jgi:uncharacterized glyoxalase superfamily protein PhnB
LLAEAKQEPGRFADTQVTIPSTREERALVAIRWLDRVPEEPNGEQRVYQVVSLRSGRIVHIQDFGDEAAARAELARPAPPAPPRQSALGSRLVPSLDARDLRETIDFYRDKLGFRVTGLHPDDGEPAWCELSRGSIRIMFSRSHDDGALALTGSLYLWPDDVVALHRELTGRGVAVEWGPEVMDYGMREFAVRDPNRYLLVFGEPA